MSLILRIRDLSAYAFADAVRRQAREMAVRSEETGLQVRFETLLGLSRFLPTAMQGKPLTVNLGDGSWLTWFMVLLSTSDNLPPEPLQGGNTMQSPRTAIVHFEVRTTGTDLGSKGILVDVEYEPSNESNPEILAHFLELFHRVDMYSPGVIKKLTEQSQALATIASQHADSNP